MAAALRGLLRPVLGALAATALLVLWIRGEPLAMPAALQVALSLVLVSAEVLLLVAVVREEREQPLPPDPLSQ